MIDKIQQRVLEATGFKLPDAYLHLQADGRLRFGASREDWQAHWKTIVTSSPPALICAPWFMAVEWDSVDELIAWKSPDDWKPNQFVSFAGNGFGDRWVWDPLRETERGTPVLLCRHDENRAEVIAASFSDFLYRILIESFSNISYESRDELDVDDVGFKSYLLLNVDTVASHIPVSYADTLRELLRNDLVEDDENECLSLLSQEEKQQLIERDLAIGEVGTTFRHLVPSGNFDAAAIKAAHDRAAAEDRKQAYAQATNDADNAFRSGHYQTYCQLLGPFPDMLTPAQQKKLSVASRKLNIENGKAE